VDWRIGFEVLPLGGASRKPTSLMPVSILIFSLID